MYIYCSLLFIDLQRKKDKKNKKNDHQKKMVIESKGEIVTKKTTYEYVDINYLISSVMSMIILSMPAITYLSGSV
jgi:hypothetical protein